MEKVIKEIPAGYRVVVTSWENDADNYKTEMVEGLSRDDVSLLVDVIQLFYSKNNPPKGRVCYGNLCEPDDEIIEQCMSAIEAVLAQHPKSSTSPLSDYFKNAEGVMEYLCDLGLSGSEFFWTRVLESFEVYYFPEAMYIQVVTDEFKYPKKGRILVSPDEIPQLSSEEQRQLNIHQSDI
jgi:hypothetical protein